MHHSITLKVLESAPSGAFALGNYPNSPSVAELNGNLYPVTGTLPTLTVLGKKAGDCDGDGKVTAAEVQLAMDPCLGVRAAHSVLIWIAPGESRRPKCRG